MKYGVTFFNFGGACVVRLFVALHSLRKYYQGPVTVFLAKGDSYNEHCAADIQRFAEIQWFDLDAISKRNLKCVLKPKLFQISPYEHTLMMDGDLLFQGDPSELVAPLIEKGFLITKFSTWNTDGSKMRGRIQKFKEHLTEEQWAVLTDGKVKIPATNIGVMGWSKSAKDVMARWESLTMAVAGLHMADEHAAQVTFPFYPTAIAEACWNESCVYPSNADYTKAKVLHFHGGKASSPSRRSSRYWIAALQDLLRSRVVPGIGEYLFWGDDSILSNLKDVPDFTHPGSIFTP